MTFPSINSCAKRGLTTLGNNSDKRLKFLYEVKDMLAGAAFPLMLQLILSVSFIGMATAITEDFALSVVMLVLGEILLCAAYVIFGRQNGITAVRKLVVQAKKRDIGTADKQAQYGTGEYSAYKGFLIGFITCIPYVLVQLIELCAHNSFCYFLLQYVFGWAAIPFTYANLSGWLNFLWIILPTAVHGVTYIIAAHREWAKQREIASRQIVKEEKDKK